MPNRFARHPLTQILAEAQALATTQALAEDQALAEAQAFAKAQRTEHDWTQPGGLSCAVPLKPSAAVARPVVRRLLMP